MRIRKSLVWIGALVAVGALTWSGLRGLQLGAIDTRDGTPVTRVRKGAVTIVVAARGQLQGRKSEVLNAPMVGGGELAIIYLRDPGDPVRAGDVVARFDTTQQEFNLSEAEADLAEAEQQVIKAEVDAEASLEEARLQVVSTTSDVKQAELEVRKNPVLAGVVGRQNDIALAAAVNRQQQAVRDYESRKTTAASTIAIQKAAVEKTRVVADNARRTIDSMSLKTKSSGYVHVQGKANDGIFYGQQTRPYKVGDTTRAGQAVAQIPDMGSWEVTARIPESDRGYLAQGQHVTVRVAAVPGREFKGHVVSVGAGTGSSWERTFECRMALDEGAPELRPGMTSNILITVAALPDVLWVPSQALFDLDGRSFVYKRTGGGFTTHDVTLVRRSESQAVITGIEEGVEVALSNPAQQARDDSTGAGGVMKALRK